jgi:N-methylhydantoinase A
MRFATDTGGTFTDLIVEDDAGRLQMYKALTTPADPVAGVLGALTLAAEARDLSLAALLAQGDVFIHGTTHAINAVLTASTAKTAFLTTMGHPDVLLFREGGRKDPFDHSIAYPDPYIPRALTFEVQERITSDGAVAVALNEAALRATLRDLRQRDVEAVAVCLLWSVVNPSHERRVGELLEEMLPGIPYTLSHRINPVMREYRRASSAAIDASLKPLMAAYLSGLTGRLREAGFAGRVLVLTSRGGMREAADLAAAPLHLLNSGPSMAPVAGREFGRQEDAQADIIVADTGGTTYDVSLVRGDRIPLSREMWIGEPFIGHMTGFPSVDVQSIGAGGGSIARVDAGGVLHVGPHSQGSEPGPACYGRGGQEATLTDAAVVLSYLDPNFFLGGRFVLDAEAARRVVEHKVARPLGLSVHDAAAAIVTVATENMVQAIVAIVVNRGVDPGRSLLIAGGGAAGLNSSFIARRLGVRKLIYPELGAALSAAGATMTDMMAEYRNAVFVSTERFDFEAANDALRALRAQGRAFLESIEDPRETSIELSVEARYRNQVWELDLPLPVESFASEREVALLVERFHQEHERIFAVRDDRSAVEVVNWCVSARARTRAASPGRLVLPATQESGCSRRECYFPGYGKRDTTTARIEDVPVNAQRAGPAIIETPFTTIVIPPEDRYYRTTDGNLVIEPFAGRA